MTQKNEELLLKDLSYRLPYGVMCQVNDGASGLNDGKLVEIYFSNESVRFDADYYWDAYIDDFKPYLRPMSSMTEEEERELTERNCQGTLTEHKYAIFYRSQDWLNSHHFDYRGLIDKGLALEAPDDMYTNN